ncbi:hypothetical protein ACFVYA_18120 [Amycolatopsis sp. NPDC058278]
MTTSSSSPGPDDRRIAQRLLAFTPAIRHNHPTGQPITRSLTAHDH